MRLLDKPVSKASKMSKCYLLHKAIAMRINIKAILDVVCLLSSSKVYGLFSAVISCCCCLML